MITEPEMSEEPHEPQAPEEAFAGESRDVVDARERWRRTRPPWTWVLGAAVATCVVGALVLQAVGYGDMPSPDLHSYHVRSPCVGDNLKPLTDAFLTHDASASPAVQETGPALDATQCVLDATGPVAKLWKGWYTVTVTVELHRKTDPTAEFEDLARAHTTPVDLFSPVGGAAFDRSTPVSGLGDEAFLLSRDDDLTLMVRHGGAVFVMNLTARQQPLDMADPPDDANGFPARPPSLSRFAPAMEASVRQVMAALAK